MKKLGIVLGMGLMTCQVFGQSFNTASNAFLIGWDVAVPTRYLTRPGWAGIRIDYREMLNPKVSVGIAASWNTFNQYYPRETYQKENGEGAITSDLIKNVYSIPITLSSHYYFRGGKKLVPYLGMNLGGMYSNQSLYINQLEVDQHNWGFVARPEIGVIAPTAFGGLFLSAAYNYATNDAFGSERLEHVAFTLGFVFGAPN